MGISASHSTIQKKRKILVKQHLERKIATAQAYTEQRKLILLEAVIDSDSERNEEILPCVINVLLTGCFIKSIFLLLYSGSRKKKLQIRLPPRHHSLEEMGLHPTYLFKGYLESVIGPSRN